MKLKRILIGVLVLALVTGACNFSFSIPSFTEGDPTAPTEAVTVATARPAVAPTLPDLPELQVLDLSQRDAILTTLYQRASQGVVSIIITTAEGGSTGSGFVYDTDGHIITNFHVVEGAEDVEVDFVSGFKTRGEVIGTDLDSDLAVIKVDVPAEVLAPLPLGDSNLVQVGQTVVAIGNPFGLSGTMTMGIVSAKGRTLESLRQTETGNFFSAGDIIQTDASINPGNSGGPLLNLNGEVVGVNRAIRTTGTTVTGDPVNSGIGFAISVNIVRRVVPELIKSGSYAYPYLGVTSRENMSLEMIEALDLPQQTGAYIIQVQEFSPAARAGLVGGTRTTSIPGLLAGGDLIIAVDGIPVKTFGEMLSYLINNKSPGDTVNFTVIHDNNSQEEVEVTLGERP